MEDAPGLDYRRVAMFKRIFKGVFDTTSTGDRMGFSHVVGKVVEDASARAYPFEVAEAPTKLSGLAPPTLDSLAWR